MSILETSIDARSREYADNRETMVERVEQLRETSRMLCNGGGEEARARHLARGKMLPRERISALIDPLSPFLEIGQFAAHGMYDGRHRLRGGDRGNWTHRGTRMHGRRQ